MQDIENRLVALEQQLAALVTAHNGALDLLATSQAFLVQALAPQAQALGVQAQQVAPHQQQYQPEPQQVVYTQQSQAQAQAPQYYPQQQPQQAVYLPPQQPQQQQVAPQQNAVSHETLQGLFMTKFNEGKGQGLQGVLANYSARTVAELPPHVLQDVFNQVVGL